MTIKIWYDMDDTLALFSHKGKSDQAMENCYEAGYYKNLPILDNSNLVLKVLNNLGYEIGIISACVASKYCKKEKMEWLEKYFPYIPKDRIHLVEIGTNKADIVNPKNAILVDDYKSNLENWQNAGGIAIKKRSSQKEGKFPVIRNHWDIFKILEEIGELK